MIKITEYHLRYEGRELGYAEKDPQTKFWRDAIEIPTDEFGAALQEKIKQLTKRFPDKSIDVRATSW